MPMMYAEPSDLSTLEPKKLATELHTTVERGFEGLCRLPEPLASQPMAKNKWSAKQVVGHMIDSAANNHQRFVRLQIEPSLYLPGYKQEEWVAVQCYSVMPWMQALETWRTFNTHLAYVIEHMRVECLGNVWHSDEGPMPLGFLIEDYLGHLKHHLKQMPNYAE